jgi:hypothetical protein
MLYEVEVFARNKQNEAVSFRTFANNYETQEEAEQMIRDSHPDYDIIFCIFNAMIVGEPNGGTEEYEEL